MLSPDKSNRSKVHVYIKLNALYLIFGREAGLDAV